MGQAVPEKETGFYQHSVLSAALPVCKIGHIYWGDPQLPHETFHFWNALWPILYKLRGRGDNFLLGSQELNLNSCTTVAGLCWCKLLQGIILHLWDLLRDIPPQPAIFSHSGISAWISLLGAELHRSGRPSLFTSPSAQISGHKGNIQSAFPLPATPRGLRHSTKAILHHAANNYAPWSNFNQATAINT